MWNERYSNKEYVYGIEPNSFLREQFQTLPQGKILSIAEGEGRNAVFLASQGYSVTAVDSSEVGLAKAERLAKKHNVAIECIHADLREFEFGANKWDGIISIFCPLPSELRASIHAKVEIGLRLGGVFLAEAYTPRQINYGTGGGDNPDTMQTKESLVNEFKNIKFSHLVETEREVIEGIYHTGLASVVQAIGCKEI